MYRDHTKVVQIGDKKIGGGNPILIQSMTNTKLFIGCTAGTVLIFALVYGLIYIMTAKSYYHIVERK